MTVSNEELELKDRLSLIESMIAEGRRSTETTAGPSSFGRGLLRRHRLDRLGLYRSLAWPVTMVAASALTGVFASRQKHSRPETTLGRAMSSIWTAMGVSMFYCPDVSRHQRQV